MRQKRNIFLLALMGLPLICVALHVIFRSKPIIERPIVISHRGAAGLAPENTLAAIKEGIKQGSNYIEVDVHRSADGVLLLIHDETVDRTTNGMGAIRELSWPDISKLDAGSHFSAEFRGEQIPSLPAALELIAVTPTALVLEIKSSSLYPEIEQQIIKHVEEFDMLDQIVVISFDAGALKKIKRLAPTAPVGFLWQWPWPPDMAGISEAKVVDLFWPDVILNPFLIGHLHQQGYQVWVWTVNNPHLMRLLLWLGVDGITTDQPDLWREANKTALTY